MAGPRVLEKFTSTDGTQSYTFPTNLLTYTPGQSIRTPDGDVIGAHYAYDYLGSQMAPRDVASEMVSFKISDASSSALESDLDTMRSTLQKIGLGYLYQISSGSVERRCYARLGDIMKPTRKAQGPINYQLGKTNLQILTVTLNFKRQSDWFDTTQQTPNSGAITSTPTTFTITNNGNARVYAVAMKLHANAASGFTSPQLQNLTNGYSWSSTRNSASNGDELIVDAGLYTVNFNSVNDFSNFTRGSQQVAYMVLEPGANSIRYTDGGTPNCTITFTFYQAYY